MPRIVVAGAGLCGMAAAMMLTRDGYEVTVLDRDDAPVPNGPDEAWASWARRGVAQFRLPHLLLPGGFQVVAQHLPEVGERLAAAGGYRWNPVEEMLPAVPGSARRNDDDRFASITARRPTLEWAFAATVADEPRVHVRRGCPLDGFVTGSDVIDGVPHVVGVRLTDGEEVRGDLVIDATGRRSATCAWLAAIGSRPPEETSEDLGFTYTSRFWRSSDGSVPETRAPGLTPCGSISLLTIPLDNGTWSTTIVTTSDDKALRATRDPKVFERVWMQFPDHAHWLDGEPISDMVMMSGTVDRTRRFVVDGTPVVTGVATIADAHSCTNPSIGRGITIGLKHTVVMRDAVARHLADPAELALAFDATTSAEIHPWHEATAIIDRQRMREIRAAIDRRAAGAVAGRRLRRRLRPSHHARRGRAPLVRGGARVSRPTDGDDVTARGVRAGPRANRRPAGARPVRSLARRAARAGRLTTPQGPGMTTCSETGCARQPAFAWAAGST